MKLWVSLISPTLIVEEEEMRGQREEARGGGKREYERGRKNENSEVVECPLSPLNELGEPLFSIFTIYGVLI